MVNDGGGREPQKKRLAVLLDGDSLTLWQHRALDQVAGEYELLFYNCTNMRPAPRRLRHAAYYLLNLHALRGPLTRRQPLGPAANRRDFACLHEGSWQRLPEDVLDHLRASGAVAVVKFGLGLLRIPEDFDLPILSYHHGDPRHFRGRPAGFYELLSGARVVGQIVQKLSNRLDAGAVVAYGEVKALPFSYRKTMAAAYRLSPLLLGPAVAAAQSGATLPIEPTGPVTRLPDTRTVLRFVWRMAKATAARLWYGMAFEKAWQVATAKESGDASADARVLPEAKAWEILPIPAGYTFLADPFFEAGTDGILVEALNARTGLGEIVRVQDGKATPLLAGGHFSYPVSFTDGATTLLLPEVSEHRAPVLYALTGDGAAPAGPLALPAETRLIDATPVRHGEHVYLFACRAEDGADVLRLWVAPAVQGPYAEHPDSPVLLSPAGARMGGNLIVRDGRLYRLGQDGRGDYGDGLLLFEIDELTPDRYREHFVRTLRFDTVRGPHTFNSRNGMMVFDFYRDRFAPLAGWRRLKAYLSRR